MNKKITKVLLIVIPILVILLIVLLILEYSPGVVDSINKDPELFVIKDECSLILNNVIHQIKNEDECRITCRNNCDLRKIDFYESEFIENENSCHTCNCYCK